jgi:putative transposase
MSAPPLADPTDVTDEAWPILAPRLPPVKPGGRPRTYPMRGVRHGIPSVLRGGGAWRVMPHALPPGPPPQQPWRAWRRDGTWLRLQDQRRDLGRPRMGRPPPQPAGALRAAQPVTATDAGGRTAMRAPNTSTAARAIAAWRRRGCAGVAASTPPL